MQFDKSLLNVQEELKILLVEDSKLSLSFTLKILENFFKNIKTAENGIKGLEIFNEFQPDVVITDIRMPVMDGLSMLKEMKKSKPDLFSVVLSAYDEKDFLKESIDIQVNHFLTKPVNAGELIETLTNLRDQIFFQKIIHRQNQLIEELLNSLDVIIGFCDKNSILGINQMGLEVLGYENFYQIQKDNMSICDFFIYEPGFLPNDKRYILENFSNIPEDQRKAKIFNQKTKREMIFQVKLFPYFAEPDKYILILYDITILEKQKEDLKKLSMIDFLTGIYNRHHFHSILEFHIEKHNRYEHLIPFIILLMDLDHFKKINDQFGHLVGDEVLKEFCNIVKSHIRKSDFFARWGGEEFIIITTEITLEQSFHFAEKILNLIREGFKFHPQLPPLTVSIGITQFIKGDTMKTILERVDEALYLAKSKGRDRFEFK